MGHNQAFVYHGDVIAIEEDLVELGYPPPLWCYFTATHLFINIVSGEPEKRCS